MAKNLERWVYAAVVRTFAQSRLQAFADAAPALQEERVGVRAADAVARAHVHGDAHADAWLPRGVWTDTAAATEHLVRRYLGGFGPASPKDLANWAGLPVTTVRPATVPSTLPPLAAAMSTTTEPGFICATASPRARLRCATSTWRGS